MSKKDRPKDVGAIWNMKTRNGSRYLSISLDVDGEKRQFVAFKNHKMKDTHPDYRIFPSQSNKGGDTRTEPRNEEKPKSTPPEEVLDESESFGDDPFPF